MNFLKIPSHCCVMTKQAILIITLAFAIPSFAQQTPEHQQPNQPETVTQQPATDQVIENANTFLPVENDTSITTEQTIQQDLSPWGMYKNADVVVKTVMIGLLLASLLTWTIFVAKLTELIAAKRKLKREMTALKAAKNLTQAKQIVNGFARNSLATLLVQDIQQELELSADTSSHEGIKERAAFRQDRLVAASGRNMNIGTGILASIGSVSPFVGLFGTVWGIMNSFIGIAKSQTTNLAVVAPGIAEALLATAMGLVAAIPAVIIYNLFTRSINHYKVLVSDISAHNLLLLSRDLDRKSHLANSAANHSNITKIG